MSISKSIPTELYEEFINAMCGKMIGEGQNRTVFELPITNEKWCVKFEHSSNRLFQNVEEWNVWQAVKDTALGRWFAPCHWISPNGMVLIMRQTQKLRKEEYPDKVPNFFTDMKFDNFGLLEGKFVAHDYGVHLISQKGLTERMITAHWWE